MTETLNESASPAMSLREALQVLHAVRSEEVVVTTMATSREWMAIGSHPLDFIFVPSSMGQATSLGLGLALAQPDREVIVCNGDGSMLMNLGSLVTITAQSPPNFTLLVFDNGVYEVTGGQPTAANTAIRNGVGRVDLSAIARGCGFTQVFRFTEIDQWRAGVRDVLDSAGPTFAHLAVAAVPGGVGPKSPSPGPERARAFATALQQNDR